MIRWIVKHICKLASLGVKCCIGNISEGAMNTGERGTICVDADKDEFVAKRVRLNYTFDVVEQESKIVELITHIAWSLRDDDKFGRTKLAKIMFYSDFRSFQHTGKPLTGIRYRKYPQGPLTAKVYEVPSREKHLKVQRKYLFFNSFQDSVKSERDWNNPARLFSVEQIRIIDAAIEELRPHSNKKCSQMSHGIAWGISDMHDGIPYESAFMAEQEDITDEDIAIMLSA